MSNIDEQSALLLRAKNNDEFAKEKLIVDNSPLIKSVIKRYLNKGVEYDDLYQLGCLGFVKAISNFDSSFNVKFSTYAVPMIAGEIKRYLRDNGIIKVSRNTKMQNILIQKYIQEYNGEYMHAPTIDEIALHFNMDVSDVVFAMDSSMCPLSLNSVVGDDEGKEQYMIEKVDSGQNVENELDKVELYNAIKDLPKRDKAIIVYRYFRDMTQKEVASMLGVSQVQVSRLESKILSKLKDKIS